jgi:hypothetical protein
MTMQREILTFYAHPTRITSPGKQASYFRDVPSDVAALSRLVPGLVLYEYVAKDFYGVSIPDERLGESHIRTIEGILDRIVDLDSRPLDVARPLDKRVVGICHHFALLLVAMLRSKGVPARARCGFGSYFNAPYYEDHWVCEYWNENDARWTLVDAQLDEVWRERLEIDFDPLDVPRDRFVVANDAWAQCRRGSADPSKFGIFKGDLRGLWFIAGCVMRDVAALNKMEVLPWDQWGAMPRDDAQLDDDHLAYFDRLATLTRTPDESFDKLCVIYESDERVRVPPTVYNAVLNRFETI